MGALEVFQEAGEIRQLALAPSSELIGTEMGGWSGCQ
jgi:hypothetical protein